MVYIRLHIRQAATSANQSACRCSSHQKYFSFFLCSWLSSFFFPLHPQTITITITVSKLLFFELAPFVASRFLSSFTEITKKI